MKWNESEARVSQRAAERASDGGDDILYIIPK